MKKFLAIVVVILLCSCDWLPRKSEEIAPQVTPQYLNLRSIWKLDKVRKVVSYEPQYKNVYVIIEDKLACVDKADSNVKWRTDYLFQQFYHQIRQWNDLVVHCYQPHFSDAILKVYKAENGEVLHSLFVPSHTNMIVEDGRAYFYSYRMLYAYDIPTGKLIWKNDFNVEGGVEDKLISFRADGETLLLENSNAQRGYNLVIRIDFFAGLQKWNNLGKLIAADENNVYILKSESNEIWARNIETGGFAFAYKLDGFTKEAFWLKNGDFIYTSRQKYNEREKAFIKKDESKYRAYDVTNNKLLFKELIRVNPKDNKVKWFITLDSGSKVSRFENIIVEAKNGRLKAFDIRYGNPIWELQLPEKIESFAVSGDMLFVHTGLEELIAYKF